MNRYLQLTSKCLYNSFFKTIYALGKKILFGIDPRSYCSAGNRSYLQTMASPATCIAHNDDRPFYQANNLAYQPMTVLVLDKKLDHVGPFRQTIKTS